MNFLIFIVILLLCFLLFKAWVDRKYFRSQTYNYFKKNQIMTDSEMKCFKSLHKATGEKYWIFPQVHFSAFLDNHIVGQSWRGSFSHVNGKSVDFMLCTKEELSPILAIELDDKSHEREDRQRRDYEEERIFKIAKMPLLRLKHADLDNINNLTKKITEALNIKFDEIEKPLKWYQKLLGLMR